MEESNKQRTKFRKTAEKTRRNTLQVALCHRTDVSPLAALEGAANEG
jgi:hypothetical protein